MKPSYEQELEYVVRLIRSAGALALSYRRAGVEAETKADDEPVTEADRAVNAHVIAALGERFPRDAILAEESPPDSGRFEAERTWMVDPIDGTREFIRGSDFWEVLIGLVVDGAPVLGAVYNAVTDTLLCGSRGRGAWSTQGSSRRPVVIEGRTDGGALTLATRHGPRPEIVDRIARALDVVDVREKRALGARMLTAVESEVDVVLNVGGSAKEWDTCAIEAIVVEAGGVLLTCLGERPRYLKEDLVQRHGMVVTSRALADRVMRVVTPLYREWSADPS